MWTKIRLFTQNQIIKYAHSKYAGESHVFNQINECFGLQW